jgi:type IX secretion system PorP/SprF family membrane protein
MNRLLIYFSLLFTLFTLTGTVLYAQEPNFTQFYAAPTYLNPAFTGAAPYYRISANYRKQWWNISNAYETQTVGFEYQSDNLNSGFGFLAVQDKAGALGVKSLQLSLLYSYKIRLSEEWVAHGALQGTYGSRSPNFSSFIFEDELLTGGTTLEPQGASINYFNLSSGIVAYNETYWFGVAVHNLLRPNQSIAKGSSPLPMHISIQSGMKFPITYDIELAPALFFQTQGAFSQLDLGTNVHLGAFITGLWYRGLPIKAIAPKTFNQDALAILTGVQYRGFYAGLSYDFRISGLKNSGGSYELAIVYHPFHDRRPKGDKYIKCPAFY